jgi:hypothetical protein
MPLRTPKGPWRDTRRQVLQDALEQGLGWRDEHETDRIYLHALAEVEWRD